MRLYASHTARRWEIQGRDGDARIMVLRRADGSLAALSMECTHWGCDVEWGKGQAELECPCHGSRFDLEGKVLEGPADDPLPSYPVSEADGVVTVGFTRLPSQSDGPI